MSKYLTYSKNINTEYCHYWRLSSCLVGYLQLKLTFYSLCLSPLTSLSGNLYSISLLIVQTPSPEASVPSLILLSPLFVEHHGLIPEMSLKSSLFPCCTGMALVQTLSMSFLGYCSSFL